MAIAKVTLSPTVAVVSAGVSSTSSGAGRRSARRAAGGDAVNPMVVVAQSRTFSPPAAVASQQVTALPCFSARKLTSIGRRCRAPRSPSRQRSCRPATSAGGLLPR